MVCAVEEIEKSTLFRGEGGKCDQDGQKFNFITKCLNTFVAHCRVVEDFGTAPYWRSSKTRRAAGLTQLVTTKSLASLERHGVREIGLKSFLTSLTGFLLGIGVTSASFHMLGRRCSLKEAFRTLVIGYTAYSFKSQSGIPSGPQALFESSLHNNYFRAFVLDFVDDCSEWALEHLGLLRSRSFYDKLFVFSVSVDTDCNKRGQTSRPAVGPEIKTSCNTETTLLDHYYLLHCVQCLCNNQYVLDISYSVMVWHVICFIVSRSLDLLLHEDFLHSSSSSTSSTRPYSTTEPNKSTEHSAIQKASVDCAVVASNLNRLLSTIFIIDNFGHSCWAIFICFSRLELYINFALLKLFVKPDSLPLEATRSETSSKGYNQTSALLLVELAVVQLVNLLAHQGKTNGGNNDGCQIRFFFKSCLELTVNT